MAEPKFTKGKCYVDFSQNPIEIVGPAKKYRRFGADGERTLATVGDDCFYEDRPELEREDRANAHLYAAAPGLYEALEEARKTIVAHEEFLADEVFDPLFAQICAALAKARGETQGGK